jgi:hypothetical protein
MMARELLIQGQEQPQSKSTGQQSPPTVTALPRGKKLILKNGDSEIVSSYSVAGDRVRYYSVERSQWEEIPSSLIDWDATHKAEADEARSQSEQLNEVEKREKERRAEAVDVDASYEVAPGVILPPGEGMYLEQGKIPLLMNPVNASLKSDKGRTAEQILVPIPVVPSRRHLQLTGGKAATRVQNPQPEFFFRTADPDEPQVELLKIRVHGDTRTIEDLESGPNSHSVVKNVVPLETWKAANGLYRFTLSQPLAPGEYVITELLPRKQDMDLEIWDFGVDPAAGAGH